MRQRGVRRPRTGLTTRASSYLLCGVVDSPDVIGQRIQTARLAAGLSQRDVAKALAVSQVAVSYWERGENLKPIQRVGRLAELLGLTADELLGVGHDEEGPS